MVSPHGQGGEGVEPVQTFSGREVNFSRFCASILYGRPYTHFQHSLVTYNILSFFLY